MSKKLLADTLYKLLYDYGLLYVLVIIETVLAYIAANLVQDKLGYYAWLFMVPSVVFAIFALLHHFTKSAKQLLALYGLLYVLVIIYTVLAYISINLVLYKLGYYAWLFMVPSVVFAIFAPRLHFILRHALDWNELSRPGRRSDMHRRVGLGRRALAFQARDRNPEVWAALQGMLGLSLSHDPLGKRADDLEEAISHYTEALTIFSSEASPKSWAAIQNNLGIVYSERIRGERADNLEQAISHYTEALMVYTREAFPDDWARTQNNLGLAYSERICGERADNLEHAISHYTEALTVHTREAFPHNYRRTQRNLGSLHFEQGKWAPAHAAYAAAIEAGAGLLVEAYTETGRQAEVGETARLYVDDTYTLLRLGRPGAGLLRLEQGKTRLLGEALALADLDLMRLPDANQEAMRLARQAVRDLEAAMRLSKDTPTSRSDRDLAQALRQARADLHRRIERIRAEHPEFMLSGLDLPDLLDLIPQGGALVAPLLTSQGAAVFVLPHGTTTVTEEHVIELKQFTSVNLFAVLWGPADEPELGGWLGGLMAYEDQESDWRGLLTQIERTGRDLWEVLVGPVYQRLSHLGLDQGAPLLLMPQGGLGLLPLHAAWRAVDGERRYFLDDYTLTYVPSGFAFHTNRRRLSEPRRIQQSLLAVVDPMGDRPFTSVEGDALLALFAPQAREALIKADATPEAVIRAATGRSYVHFACHGFYAWQDPMQSGFRLADGKLLTLADVIAGLDLSATRLVTLSACVTGLTDIRQSPDEYLGLAAGLLQAGAPAVLSTLWPVDDLSTMLLMERFYRGHLRNGLAPAPALRAAQRWLRDVTNEGLSDLFDELFEMYHDMVPDRSRMAYAMAKRCFNKFTLATDPKARPFAHPYYWGAFTFSGV